VLKVVLYCALELPVCTVSCVPHCQHGRRHSGIAIVRSHIDATHVADQSSAFRRDFVILRCEDT
jgi:hypothetical protein